MFHIEAEIKRSQGYREIMGEVELADPIDIEAKIIDMRAKIEYMNRKIRRERNESSSNIYLVKYQ